MPTHDFSDIGDVLNFDILKGNIITIDSATDTCTVSVGGDTIPALLFYHCDPDSIILESGAIEGAAGGFSVNDEVIVLINTDKSVVKVIGHTDGIRRCGPLSIYVFYDNNTKMARGEVNAGEFTIDQIYNTIDYGLYLANKKIFCHAKKLTFSVLKLDGSFVDKVFYLITMSIGLLGDTFAGGGVHRGYDDNYPTDPLVNWYIYDPSSLKYLYLGNGGMPYSSFPRNEIDLGGRPRYPYNYYPLNVMDTRCCFNISTNRRILFFSKGKIARAYQVAESSPGFYSWTNIATASLSSTFKSSGTGEWNYDGITMYPGNIWFIDRDGNLYQTSNSWVSYLAYSSSIYSPTARTFLGGYRCNPDNGSTISGVLNAEIYSPDGYYAKKDNTVNFSQAYSVSGRLYHGTLVETYSLSVTMESGSTSIESESIEVWKPIGGSGSAEEWVSSSSHYKLLQNNKAYNGSMLAKTADGIFYESYSRSIISDHESGPGGITVNEYSHNIEITISSYPSFSANPTSSYASEWLEFPIKRPYPWCHIQDENVFIRGVLIADSGASPDIFSVKKIYDGSTDISGAIATALGISEDSITGLVYAPRI